MPDFVTAIFVPPTLYLRLKCPARFKPGCVGSAVAVTIKDHCKQLRGHRHCTHGAVMSTSVSAVQKAGKWKVAPIVVKPSFIPRVQAMGAQPDKRLLIVRQVIHAKGFKHGHTETVFQAYRVLTSTEF